MIVDRLENAARHQALHPGFEPAIAALVQSGLDQLPDGRHVLDGDRLYLLISHSPGRGLAAARLEAHRQYIDIQLVLQGADVIGWKPLRECGAIDAPYDAARDVGFFRDACDAWITLPAGTFAVFFPDDAHAPLAGEGPLHKAVMKIAVDW